MKADSFRELLQAVFWIASVPQTEPASKLNFWLTVNPVAFPDLWNSMWNGGYVLQNEPLMSQLIDIMLGCETNKDNPLIKSSTKNEFAVQCLLPLPVEIFSRRDRERIMKRWHPSLKSPEESGEGLSVSTALAPAVLSLKVKIMQRPTVYDGMEYQDLANLADALSSIKTADLDVSLPLFKELTRRTMSHITANLDQSRNREYALDALKHLRKKTKTKSDDKKTQKLNFALVALFEVLIEAFGAKETQLNDLDIISRAKFASVKTSFKRHLLVQLDELLSKTKKSSKTYKQAEKSLTLLSTIDALTKLEVDLSDLVNVVDAVESFTASLDGADVDVKKRLETFISTHSLSKESNAMNSELPGNLSTMYDRKAVKETAQSLVAGKHLHEKLKLLKSSLEDSERNSLRLDKILAMRYIIMACEGKLSTSPL